MNGAGGVPPRTRRRARSCVRRVPGVRAEAHGTSAGRQSSWVTRHSLGTRSGRNRTSVAPCRIRPFEKWS